MTVKWMSLTLALETTVHGQTSTALCLRMMCSPYPSSPDHGGSFQGRGRHLFFLGPQPLPLSLGPSGKECHKIKSSWFLPGLISLWVVTAIIS